jgi:hypothetical protein
MEELASATKKSDQSQAELPLLQWVASMNEPKLPSEELSEQIADALISSGLLRKARREAVVSKLASGGMSGADWKEEIDLAAQQANGQ